MRHGIHQSVSAGLKKWLVRQGAIVVTAVDAAESSARDHGEKLLTFLVRTEGADEEMLLKKLSADLSLEVVSLKDAKVLGAIRHSGLVGRFASELLLKHRFLPLSENDEILWIALADPLDTSAISEVEFRSGKRIRVKIAREREIIDAIGRLMGLHEAELIDSSDTLSPSPRGSQELIIGEIGHYDSEEAASASTPIVRLVNQILCDAETVGSSDIHLEPMRDCLEIRFRVDGVMVTHLSLPKRLQSYVTARLKLLAGMDITEKRRPQDGRFRIRGGETGGTDIRASSVPTAHGEKLVLRLLSGGGDLADLSSLELPSPILDRFRRLLSTRDRLVVVTGPTGSGKTTTLYAALAELRLAVGSIVTVEDPVERRIDGVTQIQVDTKIGVSFASGLRSILRQDPDVILVGEIRDGETAHIALQAAQTGHLVLSTLHTNSAVAAVIRLRDLGVEPFIISSSLGGVLAQRLVRRLCTDCRVQVQAPEALTAANGLMLADSSVYAPRGCAACGGSGFRGRVGIYSLVEIDDTMRELIRAGRGEDELERAARDRGTESLNEAGLRLVSAGTTSFDEIERVLGKITPRQDTARIPAKAPIAQPGIEPADDPLFPPETTAKKRRGGEGTASIAALASQARGGDAPAEKHPTIVLIDDDESVRSIMGHVLRRSSFDVIEAEDGSEGYAKILEHQPDAVVCDLIMPRVGGLELVRRLRDNPVTAEIPVLMLTGSDTETNEIALIDAGARDFVSKASSPAIVVSRVRRLIAS